MTIQINDVSKELENTRNQILAQLKKYRLKKDEITRILFMSEDIITTYKNANPISTVKITMSNLLGFKKMIFECDGEDAHLRDALAIDLIGEVNSPESASTLAIMERAYGNKYVIAYKNKKNSIKIKVSEPNQKNLIFTLIAMIAGVLLGILFKAVVPQTALDGIMTYGMNPIKTIFLNALKMVMAPMVFFSIVSCLNQFGDMKSLGRLGLKIVIIYFVTTLISVLLGLCCNSLINPGVEGEFVNTVNSITDTTVEAPSLLDTIIGIVPDNFLGAFVKNDMLAIIFLSVLFGLAIGMLGEKSAKVAHFMDCGNELFSTVTAIITKFLPLMIFATMFSIPVSLDANSIANLGMLLVTLLLANVLVLVMYLLIVLIMNRENPFVFFKRAFPAWLNAFALCSSNGAMPKTMETLDKNLHVDKKIYSFSVPLGSTINMNAFAPVLLITTLFLAKCYSVTLDPSAIVLLIFMTVVVAVSTPGIPGASLMSLQVLLSSVNVPLAGVLLVAPVFSMLDPILTSGNVLGDITSTYVIAKQEHLIHYEEEKQTDKQ